jgi:hypothetical protein
MVAVLEIVSGLGIPGYWKSALNEPEAVTDTMTTQFPDGDPNAGQLPALALFCVSQGLYVVIVPAESHPQDTEDVTVNALTSIPLSAVVPEVAPAKS